MSCLINLNEIRMNTLEGMYYKNAYILNIRFGVIPLFCLNIYFCTKERGLHQLMGEETFRDVFSIRTREDIIKTSLTFVIDVTGSMGDDINGVKTATKNIVNEAKDSAFVPKNYILVTFSDPGMSNKRNCYLV